MAAPETAAPAPAETPFVSDALRLVRAPFSPGAVFAEMQDRPRFWVPWVIVSVVAAILAFLNQPFQNRVRDLMLERAGRPAPSGGGAGAIIGVLGAPVTVLVIAAIAGGILYLIASSVGGETTYKKMLAVVIHCWPLTLLQQILTYVVLTMRGVDAITGPADMMVSMGLDLLLPSDAPMGFLRLFLAGIGPLQIWALAISAVGVQVLARTGKGQAWTAATINFLIGLTIGAALGAFGMKMAGGG